MLKSVKTYFSYFTDNKTVTWCEIWGYHGGENSTAVLLPPSSPWKMEAATSSKTFVSYYTMCCCNPEDGLNDLVTTSNF